jgi:hypothetical protein
MFHVAAASDQHLLAEWRWLLGGRPRLAGWSSAGDLFVEGTEGQILMLDPGAGSTEVIADSFSELQSLLEDETRSSLLLQKAVVDAFEAVNGPLPEGRCLSFTTLPVFGGAYTVDNRYSLSIREHAEVTGDIHRQLRELPDGTTVRIKTVP